MNNQSHTLFLGFQRVACHYDDSEYGHGHGHVIKNISRIGWLWTAGLPKKASGPGTSAEPTVTVKVCDVQLGRVRWMRSMHTTWEGHENAETSQWNHSMVMAITHLRSWGSSLIWSWLANKWKFPTVFNSWFVSVYHCDSVGTIPIYFASRCLVFEDIFEDFYHIFVS
jgi:hypothetical protein